MNFFGLSWMEAGVLVAKTVVVLVVLTGLYRLLGKRDMAQLNVYDLVTIIALSNAIQNAITAGRGEFGVGIASAGTLILCSYLISRVIVAYPKSERFFCGNPVVLIHNGHKVSRKLDREGISDEEMMAILRSHGLEHYSQVKLAVIEVDGAISVVPYENS